MESLITEVLWMKHQPNGEDRFRLLTTFGLAVEVRTTYNDLSAPKKDALLVRWAPPCCFGGERMRNRCLSCQKAYAPIADISFQLSPDPGAGASVLDAWCSYFYRPFESTLTAQQLWFELEDFARPIPELVHHYNRGLVTPLWEELKNRSALMVDARGRRVRV